MNQCASDSYRNPLRYQGQDYSFAPRYVRQRDPLAPTHQSADIKPKENQGYYPLGSLWNNTANGTLWFLASITNNLANWMLLSSGTEGPILDITVPNGVSPIIADPSGTVNFTSTNNTVVITGSSASPNNHTINFDITNFFPFQYVTVNNSQSPYVALPTDVFISCDPTAGTITIQLPNAPTQFKQYIIKDRTGLASTNNITVTTVGGAVLIDGSASYVIAGNHGSITLLFNGTSYEVF